MHYVYYTHTYMYVCMYVFLCIDACMCVCIFMHEDVCADVASLKV